ncbi:aminotransferase class I/II-fold pyridoxal phosphate-dependent enzyme [Thalassotalea hakodatensis]|uniref:aminotransferase class I/II-fold pyridoxal phosphate-dependent enzyme n=1 Tax=Thalassotalea hakodatensis TaxID=3030492 RepID=UPI0025743895|nr:8-amino-7-oxononanoate synthase [Thalassotalea hakodatensis]
MAFDFIDQHLATRKEQHLYRQRVLIEQQNARHLVHNGKQYLNFSSNDYLGLNHHPKINAALNEGAEKYGVCSSGSSLLTGFNYAHQYLENVICQWQNKDKCLLFNSGFSANFASLNAFAQPSAAIWLDKLSHASLLDGAFSQQAKVKRFLHNDYQQLNNLINTSSYRDHLIVSEGIFSMDGDGADINALAKVAQQHQAKLYIDDAHSIGITGNEGQGSSSVSNDIDIIMATFGKALATSGAFIACDNYTYEYLVNVSRHYIYSTAMSPAIAWATAKSIELVISESWRREKIAHLSQLLKQSLNTQITLLPTASSIHALVLGSEQLAMQSAETLKQYGIWLSAIRPPTVPKGSSRLRVTITSSHKEQDIKYLAECVNKVIGKNDR